MDDLQHRIDRTLRAGTRGLVLHTRDETRALRLLEATGEALGWPVHTWSRAGGIDRDGRDHPLAIVLQKLAREHDDALWVVFDAGLELGCGLTRRALRELAQRELGPAVVAIEPAVSLGMRSPGEVVPELVALHMPPPGEPTLAGRVHDIADALEQGGYTEARARLVPAAGRIARVALGLDESTFERVLAEAVIDHGPEPEAIERFVARAKAGLGTHAGLLEPATPALVDEVGGLDDLKRWLERRALALEPEARAAGIAAPRGVLLLGVQGCGKSLAARSTANVLGLPLVRLELGRLFGGTVGESEANLRAATQTAERMAPVVLWIDEIDKGLATSERSHGDAGTSARVVGGLLTWLQERERPVFVVATANRVDLLPPELLRRGRLDEIFFVDLPNADARELILRIHLVVRPERRLGVVPPLADAVQAFVEVARRADGFSGAELEAALTEARLDAFAERRPLAARDLARAIAATVPLSVARAEDVAGLRRWASERARRA